MDTTEHDRTDDMTWQVKTVKKVASFKEVNAKQNNITSEILSRQNPKDKQTDSMSVLQSNFVIPDR